MQLDKRLFLPIGWVFFLACSMHAQTDSLPQTNQPIDANFLFSYYTQDGNNSAVTGGTGTESLQDYSTQIAVFIPVDSLNNFNIEAGIHLYTSASTDNIDNRKSSASSMDLQTSFYLEWEQQLPNTQQTWSFKTGGAVESDYLSFSFMGGWNWRSDDDNFGLQLNGRVDFDRWILYFPVELRNQTHPNITTDKRNAYTFSWQYDQVLSPRIRAAIFGDVVYQAGLLSTPFHRVFFEDESLPRLEQFPGERWKTPLGVQFNYFIANPLVLRLYYRFYWDSFQIQAHSVNVSLPIKLSSTLSFSPVFRLHYQDGSPFFQPFQQHQADADFYTSDYDLSTFNSQQYGLSMRWLPLWRVGKSLTLRNLSTRLLHYRRSDGLRSWAVSTFLNWRF